MKIYKYNFTLLEVIISLAILTMGLMVALDTASNATRRSGKAYKVWNRQHILAQAAEFYLLAGPRAELPESVFPYKNYSVTCDVVEVEGLPDDGVAEVGSWQLMCLNIKLHDENGDTVESLKIDRIMHGDEL